MVAYITARLSVRDAYVSIRQHTSAYVSIRQHTSAYVRIRPHTARDSGGAGGWLQRNWESAEGRKKRTSKRFPATGLYAVYLLYWYKSTDADAALALAAKRMHYFSDLTILCALFPILLMNETSR